jgi:hypothetical protein
VQTVEGGKGSTAELVHESLIHAWPTLRRWLDENQDDAALVDQMRIAARQWHQKGRTTDLLWRGEAADEAKKFRKRYKGPLSDAERAFLDEVITYDTALARRRRTAIIGAFIGLGALVVAAMVVAVIIQRRGAEIKKSRDEVVRQSDIAAQASLQKEEALNKQLEEAAKTLAAERKTREEEQKRLEAEEQKLVVDRKLGVAEGQLIADNEKLKIAYQRQKIATEIARANETIAKNAEHEAQLAKTDLQKALEAEKQRVKRLEKERGAIVDDLK